MFDLASDKALEHKPDLLIFAFISDDLTRSRWWTKPLLIDGYERPLLSPEKMDFNLSTASDEYLVNPLVSLQWCKESLASNKTNPILDAVNKQYLKIRESTFKIRNIQENSIYSINSYLFNRLVFGDAFFIKSIPVIPQVKFDDFSKDDNFLEKVKIINGTNIPYIIFHLPTQEDMDNQKITLSKNQESLMNSLEVITGKKIVFLHKNIDRNTMPNKINLAPYDGHPNYDGLRLYAEQIGSYILKYHL
jgi:hypothetical protein